MLDYQHLMTYDTYSKISNVIVTGKSGAGKQPRIDVLREEFNLEQLSTGNIFRKYLKTFNEFDYKKSLSEFWDYENQRFVPEEQIARTIETKDKEIILGLKAKYFVDQGLFVPDAITNALFEAAFAQTNYRNQILDGYPRTLNQAIFLLDLIKIHTSKIDFILLVENTDEHIIERTIKRRICPKCGRVYHLAFKPPKQGKCELCNVDVIQRSDDTEEKIQSRLREFQEKTLPAIHYLKNNEIPVITVPGHIKIFTQENVRKSVIGELRKVMPQFS